MTYSWLAVFLFLISLFPNSAFSTECKLQIPGSLFKSTPSILKSYQAVLSTHEMRETGEKRDGTKFSIFRGGCIEYGETWVFQFLKGQKSPQDISHWLFQVAQIIKELGRSAKNSQFLKKGEDLEKVGKNWNKKTPSPTSFTLGSDQVDLTLSEVKPDWIKIQLVIGNAL